MNFDMTFFERLLQYIEFKGETISSFNKNCGFSNGLLAKLIKTKGSLGLDKIEKIFSLYDINPTWLFLGLGNMVIDKSTPTDNHCQYCEDKDRLVESYKNLINQLEKEIERLKRGN